MVLRLRAQAESRELSRPPSVLPTDSGDRRLDRDRRPDERNAVDAQNSQKLLRIIITIITRHRQLRVEAGLLHDSEGLVPAADDA